MAFSMSEYLKNKQNSANASGTKVPGAKRFSMSEYVNGTRGKPADIDSAIAMGKKREAELNSINTEKAYRNAEANFLGQRLEKIGQDMVFDKGASQDTMNRTLYPLIRADLKAAANAEAEEKANSTVRDRLKAAAAAPAGNVHDYAKVVKGTVGTPVQDAYEAFMREKTDYNRYMVRPDFQQYSTQGANIVNPTFDEAQGNGVFFGKRPGAADVGNIVTFSRSNMDAISDRMAGDDRSDFVGNPLYSYMTDDEVSIYNYILAKEGKEEAQIYLDSIEEQLNARYGNKVAGDVAKTKGIMHSLMAAGLSTSAGLDQYVQNMKQLGSEYRLPTSATQFAYQDMQKDLEETNRVGYVANDVINQISNMAPSILASAMAGAIGVPAKIAGNLAAGSVGLSAAGGTYNQALAEGRNKDEAKTVATLVGASEAVLSRLLSGISAFSGVSAEKMLLKVAAIENAAWRVLGAAGVKLGGEVMEEELQSFLEPLFKTIVYGDKYDAPTVGELAYTAFITALTTGILEGGNVAKYRTQEGARRAAGVDGPVKMDTDPAVSQTGKQGVSAPATEVGAPGVVEPVNAPAASQTEQKKASTGMRDPMQVLMDENRKKQAQQNEKTAAETQQNVSEDNAEKKAPGFYSNDRFTGTNEETQYLDRLAKAAGISIEMSATKDGRNGWIVNGEAHLSENAEDPLRVVAKHEITHHLKDAAGEAYSEYRRYVEQIYRDRGTLDQQIKAIQNLYRENGEELTWDGAMDELAADYAGELLDNEVLIRRLAGENRNLAQRILDGIRDLIRRVKTAFGGEEVKQLDRAARLWEAALTDANAAYQRGEIAATTDTRYSTAEVNAKTADLDALSEAEEMERQSVKGSRDLQKQIDALERQNKRLKEQMKRTDVPKVRREVVKRSAKDLKSMYSSKIDVNVLTDRIEALYNEISARSGSGSLQELNGVPTWAEVRAEARSIADAILAESRGNVNPMAEEYSEIRKELRGRKISISDEYRADLESAGGYEGIRRQNFGTFSLTKDGTPIDTVYEELNEKYPVLFPDSIVHPADQLVRLSDVMQELKAVEGNPFENDLDATAQYLAGEIEERFYDTPNQKPTLADKMENTYHRQRSRDQKQLRAKLADQRRAYEKQVDEIHTRYADENRKRIENQNAAQRRETIYRHANRLGKMLERPTDKRHVPEQLRGAALHMLRYINTESNYQLAKGSDGKYHRTDPMEVLYQRMYGGEVSDVKETGRTAAARALKAVYDDILKEGELSVDPDIGDYLEELAKMGNKPLGNMNRAELDTVWRVMQVVEHSITKANELHGEGRYRTVESMANALSEGVGNRKDRTNWAGPAGMVDQLLNRDMITPETFFHVLGDIGENIFRQMRNSADRQTAIVKEGSERAAKLIRDSGVEFKKADKEHHTFHLDGGDLTLSTSQLMELYALSKRKQAMEHIYIGGLKSVGGIKGLKETGRSKPVKVTPADVATMLEVLTDEQKALMDGLQAYLSGDLAKHGNEESMKVYGYEKFKEKNYWPIKVSRTETKSDPTSEARSKTIPGYGMTKAVIPRASNSVELRSAIDTFAAHLNQMATYASWLGTSEDVTRLHNFKFTDDQNRADGTVKELFERVYGKKGSAYLDALLSDIAQGTKTGADKSVIEGMFSRWKAAKVGGNLRVIVQQPTAILRAMSVINPKYLAVAKNPLAGWKKALKYSPIAQWKDWGYFEMDTGRSIRELITGTESNLDKAKNASMWGAGAADSVAWGHLWNAVEAETADKHEELSKGSKEFYEAVAARFAEVVDRTQVVDSVLHRTQIMRSNSYAAKISTSFMSEPSKVYNMVVRDLYDLNNAGSNEKKTAAKKQLARTSSALIVSFAINAAAQALVDGLRDDDRDKKYGEKFAAALPGNFASNFNPVSYIPYFKDVWSLIEGYTLDRSDMEGISDLINAVGQLGKAMMGESEKTVLNAGLNAACRLGDLLGIPVSNLKRDAAAIFDTVLSDAEMFELQYEADKLLYNQDNASGVFYGDLYRSMNNDYDAYENIYEDMYEGMVERGVSEDDAEEDIASAMESRMKKELGVESVKSLPVRYSPPTSENPEDPFFALIKKARENDTGWIEQLDPGSIEIAQAVDEVRDQKAIEKIKVIASQPYGDDLKKLAMRNVMSESLWGRYLKALNAGVTSEQYAEFLEAIAKEATKRTGKPDATATQADVEAVLYKSKLSEAQKDAIWDSYGWKTQRPR